MKPLLWETKLVDVALRLISPIATALGKSKQFQTVKHARVSLLNQPVAKSFLFDRLRPEDAMAQSAHYYLGHCLLKMEKFENARLAFGKANKIAGNATLAEDALYEYAKISFSTRYFEDALVAFQDGHASPLS